MNSAGIGNGPAWYEPCQVALLVPAGGEVELVQSDAKSGLRLRRPLDAAARFTAAPGMTH